MGQDCVERLIGRLLTDTRFRVRARLNLEQACHEEGYQLSAEELRLMKQTDLNRFGRASDGLNEGIKRFSASPNCQPPQDTEQSQTSTRTRNN